MRSYSLIKALLAESAEVVGTDTVLASSVFPIQRDLNAKHVLMGLEYHRPGGRGRSILCCRDSNGDLHVIDGHHGWAVACIKQDKIQINIIDGDPETITDELLNSECQGSRPIPEELDLVSYPEELIDQYGRNVDVTPEDIMRLPKPRVNNGEGILKADMPQCDHLRK